MSKVRFNNRCLVVADSVMETTLKVADKASKTNFPVLLCGESGTGKELIARYVHEKSARKDAPFVSINCAAIPEGLLESELFGHEKGAFTGATNNRIGKFERANGGTLLLDEISEMPLPLQAKLLRALQESEIDRLGGGDPISVDCRIIATTNKDPMELIEEGSFREDLYYRLNVIRVECSPLRGRREAILGLAQEFMTEAAESKGEEDMSLEQSGAEALLAHAWPGNIRELKNVMERAVWLADGTELTNSHFTFQKKRTSKVETEGLPLAEVERRHILSTLEKHGGNRTHAAVALGISIRTLRNKLRIYREGAGKSN